MSNAWAVEPEWHNRGGLWAVAVVVHPKVRNEKKQTWNKSPVPVKGCGPL